MAYAIVKVLMLALARKKGKNSGQSMSDTKVDSVTNYLLLKNSLDKRKGFTNKKLQKLLYYTQAWNLVLHDETMFSDKFEAWIHGPAIPTVYGKYKKYGFMNITQEPDEDLIKALSSNDKLLIDAVWEVYGKYDGDYLELLSHNEAPWQKARANSDPFKPSKNVISEDDMKAFYGKLQEADS